MKKTNVVCFILIILFIMPTGIKLVSRDLKPDTAEYYLNEGFLYLNSGDFNNAEKRFLKALKKKPNILDAYQGLGIVYLNKREFKKSVEYFQQLVKLNPDNYDAFNYLGVAYTEMGEFNLAKENLLVAANAGRYKTPENAFVNLAVLELRQKRYDNALRYVDKGMEKNDHFPPLYNLKGIILENQDKLTEAIECYEKGLALLKEADSSFLMNMAKIYIKLNEKDKAIDLLERSLSKSPSDDVKKTIRQMIIDLEK
jgi:tetratricopeptide (TPR) repeat protein